jgi:hypothetical protein
MFVLYLDIWLATPQRNPYSEVIMRARSSAGEHYVDIVGVTGSIPVAPTIVFHLKRC